MDQEKKQIFVGAAVVAAVALMLTYAYGGGQLKPVSGYSLYATFNKIDGLADGDDVRLGGIKIGTVNGQRLDDYFRAVLTFQIDMDVRLPADTSAAIHTDGLFGEKFVILEPGGETELLEPGDEISFTQDSVVVNDLLELIIAEGKSLRAQSAGGATKDKE